MKADFLHRWSASFVVVILLMTLGCDQIPEPKAARPTPPTMGERAHELLLKVVRTQECAAQKNRVLQSQKAVVIQNIDLLFSQFPMPAPSMAAIHNNLAWLENNKIEDLTDEMALLLHDRGDDLTRSLTSLFDFVTLKAPTDEQIWKGALFLKEEALQSLVNNVQSAAAADIEALREVATHLQTIIQDDGRILYDALFFDLVYGWPTAEQLWTLFDFAARDEVAALVTRAREALVEIEKPTREETKALFSLIAQLKAQLASEDVRFIHTALQGLPATAPSVDEVLMALKLYRNEEVKKALSSLWSDREKLHALLLESRELLRPDQVGGKFLEVYAKRFVDEEKTRAFLLGLAKMAGDQGGWPQFLQKWGLSMCLGESLTGYRVGRSACLTAMTRAGLDQTLSEGLLDFAEPFYRDGSLNRLFDLQARFDLFRETHRADFEAFEPMRTLFSPSDARLEQWALYFKDNAAAQKAADKLYRLLLDDTLFKSVDDMSQLGLALLEREKATVALAQRLLHDYGWSLDTIGEDRVRFVYTYASEPVHQEAAKALLRMATNEATLGEFAALNHLAEQIYTRHANDLPLLKTLTAKLGLPLEIPSVETIQKGLDYVSDPKHLQAAFDFGDILSTLVMMGMQSSFSPLPVESLFVFEGEAQDFFAFSEKVRFEDVQAASYLSRLAFGFWTMSSANKCKALSLEELSAQDLRGTFGQIEKFLSAKEYGLKSWLSLLRRAAHDVNQPRK